MKLDLYIIIQKKKSKGIYGKATNDELKNLNEEGIEKLVTKVLEMI